MGEVLAMIKKSTSINFSDPGSSDILQKIVCAMGFSIL